MEAALVVACQCRGQKRQQRLHLGLQQMGLIDHKEAAARQPFRPARVQHQFNPQRLWQIEVADRCQKAVHRGA